MPIIEAKPYRVKTQDGELTYGSLEEVKNAYVLGLIESDDEVLKEGDTVWRKAGTIPLLVTAASTRRKKNVSAERKYWIAGLLALLLLSIFYSIHEGKVILVVPALVVFAVSSILMRRAARIKK